MVVHVGGAWHDVRERWSARTRRRCAPSSLYLCQGWAERVRDEGGTDDNKYPRPERRQTRRVSVNDVLVDDVTDLSKFCDAFLVKLRALNRENVLENAEHWTYGHDDADCGCEQRIARVRLCF